MIKILTKDQIKFLQSAIEYIVLSVEGKTPNNTKLSDRDKVKLLNNCYVMDRILASDDGADEADSKKDEDVLDDTILAFEKALGIARD